MNQLLEVKLFNRFWFLNKGAKKPITQGLLAFGCLCGDGWFSLIWELCEKLEKIVPEEWKDKEFYVTEIKEKLGGLRFYISYGNDEIYNLIEEYEEKSYKTCEHCGKKGKERKITGWYHTLCNNCAKKLKEERKKRYGL